MFAGELKKLVAEEDRAILAEAESREGEKEGVARGALAVTGAAGRRERRGIDDYQQDVAMNDKM